MSNALVASTQNSNNCAISCRVVITGTDASVQLSEISTAYAIKGGQGLSTQNANSSAISASETITGTSSDTQQKDFANILAYPGIVIAMTGGADFALVGHGVSSIIRLSSCNSGFTAYGKGSGSVASLKSSFNLTGRIGVNGKGLFPGPQAIFAGTGNAGIKGNILISALNSKFAGNGNSGRIARIAINSANSAFSGNGTAKKFGGNSITITSLDASFLSSGSYSKNWGILQFIPHEVR